jgi:uncharacterized protein
MPVPMPEFLIDGPKRAPVTFALTHGAGAAMDTPFMTTFAEGLALRGHRIIRFEFPYMHERRISGKKRPPDRAPVLLDTWRAVAAKINAKRLVVGGKSMGGRIASLLAAEREETGDPLSGIVCLGYPFHPPGKPDKLRVDHLRGLKTPTLIVQGERDPFGKKDEVKSYRLPKSIRFHWLTDGEHSFKPRKASGRTEADNWTQGIEAIDGFLTGLKQP